MVLLSTKPNHNMSSNNEQEQTICCMGLFAEKVWTTEEIEESMYENDHDVNFTTVTMVHTECVHSHMLDKFKSLSPTTVISRYSKLDKDRFMIRKVSCNKEFSIVLIYKKNKEDNTSFLEDGTVYIADLRFKIKEYIIGSEYPEITYVLYV